MINERKLTENELEKREVALKGLLKNKHSLVKKYGKDAEKVMYGIATKQAKNKIETMNLDKIKEVIQGLDIGSRVKIAKEYGGGKGTVEDIKGSFVVVKTKKGNESFHESDLTPIDERIKELVKKTLTKEDNDPSGADLEGDPGEHVEENINEANLNPELIKKVSQFVKGVAKYYDYAEESALYSIQDALKQLYPGIREEVNEGFKLTFRDAGITDLMDLKNAMSALKKADVSWDQWGRAFRFDSKQDREKAKEALELKESLNEGKWTNIMRGVRKAPQPPFSIVAIQGGKVVDQKISISDQNAIPAHYEDIKRKNPGAKISIENGEGLSLYNESLNENVSSPYIYQVGDMVQNVNPTCPHHGSKGIVMSIEPDELTYSVTNSGDTFKPGMRLTKTLDQLAAL